MSKTLTIEIGALTPEQAQDMSAVLTGLVLPWAIAFVNKSHWGKAVRIGVTVAFSIASALLESAFTSGATVASGATLAVKIFWAATVTYQHLWKKFGIEEFEAATTKVASDG